MYPTFDEVLAALTDAGIVIDDELKDTIQQYGEGMEQEGWESGFDSGTSDGYGQGFDDGRWEAGSESV